MNPPMQIETLAALVKACMEEILKIQVVNQKLKNRIEMLERGSVDVSITSSNEPTA
jgi:hypothetical protein